MWFPVVWCAGDGVIPVRAHAETSKSLCTCMRRGGQLVRVVGGFQAPPRELACWWLQSSAGGHGATWPTTYPVEADTKLNDPIKSQDWGSHCAEPWEDRVWVPSVVWETEGGPSISPVVREAAAAALRDHKGVTSKGGTALVWCPRVRARPFSSQCACHTICAFEQ